MVIFLAEASRTLFFISSAWQWPGSFHLSLCGLSSPSTFKTLSPSPTQRLSASSRARTFLLCQGQAACPQVPTSDKPLLRILKFR